MDKKGFYLRELSALEALNAMKEAEKLFDTYREDGYDLVLLRGMCEYAAILSYALCIGDGRAFATPKEVLQQLSIRQLAFWGQTYESDYPEEGEESVNENFPLPDERGG